jgi:hypothetical protein
MNAPIRLAYRVPVVFISREAAKRLCGGSEKYIVSNYCKEYYLLRRSAEVSFLGNFRAHWNSLEFLGNDFQVLHHFD